MNFIEMKTLLRTYINDPHKGIYDDEQLRLILNEAYNFVYNALIAEKIYLYTRQETVTFAANTQEIAFSRTNDMIKIIYVLDENDIRVPVYREQDSKSSDRRSFYVGEDINIDPTDNSLTKQRASVLGYFKKTSSSFDAVIYYAAKIQHLLYNSGNPDKKVIHVIPEYHHNVIILRATAILWSIKGITPEILLNLQWWESKYREEFEVMKNSVGLDPDVNEEVVDVR